MIYGKLIAGAIGWVVGGIFGLVIGVFIGHSFDKGLARTFSFASQENIARIKLSFFETTFVLLGYLAKVDGRISQQEIDHTEAIITQMGLNGQQRQDAIDLFKKGAAADFQPEPALAEFNQVCGAQKQLRQTLLMFLISMALADNHSVGESELGALGRIAGPIGISPAQLQQLLDNRPNLPRLGFLP